MGSEVRQERSPPWRVSGTWGGVVIQKGAWGSRALHRKRRNTGTEFAVGSIKRSRNHSLTEVLLSQNRMRATQVMLEISSSRIRESQMKFTLTAYFT